MMKQVSWSFFSVAIFLITAAAANAETHTVSMKSISYEPKKLAVQIGDEVQWINTSLTPHSATFSDLGVEPDLDTGLVDPKKTTKKLKFTKAGLFSYHCSIHGTSMSGQIEVKP